MSHELYTSEALIGDDYEAMALEESLREGQGTCIGIDSKEYYVHMHGDKHGVPLICFHGFGEDGRTWDQLTLPGFRIYAIDMMGHGKTSVPWSPTSYDSDIILDDLQFLCTVISRRKPFVLLGYSMGGRLALQMALEYPDLPYRALILESASPGIKDRQDRLQRCIKDAGLAARIESHGAIWFANYWEKLPIFETQRHLSPAVQAAIRQRRCEVSPHGLAGMLRGAGQGMFLYAGNKLNRLKMPTLYISGELDEKYDTIRREVYAQWPNITTTSVAGAGHNVHVEKPEEFAEIVGLFLGC